MEIVYHIDKLATIYRMYVYSVREETDETYELNEGGYLRKDDPCVHTDEKLALLKLTNLNDGLISEYNRLASTAYGDAEKLIKRMSAKEDS